MLIVKMPAVPGIILLSVFAAAFITDFVITVTELAKMPKKLGALLEAEKALRAISDKIGENISDTTIAAKEKGSEIAVENKPKINELKAEYEKKKQEFSAAFEKRNFVHRRIVKAFPNLKNGRYSAVYERAVALKKKATNWKKQ